MTEEIQDAFVKLDFVRLFPHKTWVSSWSKDSQYPDGFRYKLFTIRHAEEKRFEMVLVLETSEGDKEEMERLILSPSAVERTCQIFTNGLAEEHEIDFEEQDFSDVSTLDEYEKRAKMFGWKEGI